MSNWRRFAVWRIFYSTKPVFKSRRIKIYKSGRIVSSVICFIIKRIISLWFWRCFFWLGKGKTRWRNRFLVTTFIQFIFLFSLVHPREMLLGFLSICLAFAVFAYSTSKHPEAVEFKKNHPLISLAVIVAAGYFLVCVIGSVVTFMFGIALPLLRK